MDWASAALRALFIVAYFAASTVWLPSAVLRAGPVTRAASSVQGIVGTAVWLGAMVVGIWLLRLSQRRGLI